jgi:peptide/nickel transport system ATP-binding protein
MSGWDDRGGPAQPLLIARALEKSFPVRGGRALLHAVDGVTFSIAKGETLGVVGESGCGKSTLARLLVNLIPADQGELIYDGEAVGAPDGISRKALCRAAQLVFQDSYASLNPRMTITDTLCFGPMSHGMRRADAVDRARHLLATVGLDPVRHGACLPHLLSGGQRQRVNIARALSLEPRLVIMDEPVSALDKSVEAQVLNLLLDLKRQLGLTYLFISHDLAVVRHVADRVMVMYLGRIAEIGPAEAVYGNPQHPYTRGLLASRLSMDPERRLSEPPLAGDPPSPIDPPPGCRFAGRCPHVEAICRQTMPELAADPANPEHEVACHMLVPASGHSAAVVS